MDNERWNSQPNGQETIGKQVDNGTLLHFGIFVSLCNAGLKVKICVFFISLNHLTTKQTCSFSLYFKGAATVISQTVAAVIVMEIKLVVEF